MNQVRITVKRTDFRLHADLLLPTRGITMLFGPSGSGKTTVLRCVAGLERPHDALILIGDQAWQDDTQGIFLAPWRRPLGYVFQEASLFDHLDVRGNLLYAQKRAAADGPEISMDHAIDLLGLLGRAE